MVGLWERGRRPSRVHRALLCQFFGRPPHELGLPGPPLDGARHEGGVGTRRREFIVGAAGAVAGTAAGADPLLAALVRLAHVAGQSLDAAIDGFESLIWDLGLCYSREPAQRLFVRLDGLLGIVQELLDGRLPRVPRRRLQSVAGFTAGMLSNALYDLGDSAAAGVNAALALEYGRLAGDERVVAYVRDRQAMMAEEGGRFRDALGLARAGLEAAPLGSPIAARLGCTEAVVSARLGQRADAMRALRRFERAYAAVPSDVIGEGLFSVSVTEPDVANGCVLRELGDLGGAERRTESVVRHYEAAVGEARKPTHLAIVRFDLSDILRRQGRLGEAVDVAVQALGGDRVCGPVLLRAAAFEVVLGRDHPALPEGRRFRDQLLALETPPRILGS
jgi:hypothetical protein